MNNILSYEDFVNEGAFFDKVKNAYKKVDDWYSDKNNAADFMKTMVVVVYISAYIAERSEGPVPLEKVLAYIIAGGFMSKAAGFTVRTAHDIAGVFSPSKNLENHMSDYIKALGEKGMASKKTAQLGDKLKALAKKEKIAAELKGKSNPKIEKLVANIEKHI